MSTLFTEIYELNEIVKNDKRISAKPTNLIYKLYYQYLRMSIGFFQRDCYVDLMDHSPFSQTEYLFKYDGIVLEFLLESTSIPSDGCSFYVGYTQSLDVSYTEIKPSDYSYDSTTHVLTINLGINEIVKDSYVYVSSYQIGQFNQTLSFDEQNILVEGMLVPFLKEQQNRNSLLTQIVYGGGHKMSSQAEHLKQVHTVAKDQEDSVRLMIKEYSYSANPQNLIKLGGGN